MLLPGPGRVGVNGQGPNRDTGAAAVDAHARDAGCHQRVGADSGIGTAEAAAAVVHQHATRLGALHEGDEASPDAEAKVDAETRERAEAENTRRAAGGGAPTPPTPRDFAHPSTLHLRSGFLRPLEFGVRVG